MHHRDRRRGRADDRAGEQTVLARGLNEGLASAVSQYVTERDIELRREVSEYLGFIAHEVRTPMSSARMALGLLQNGAPRRPGGRAPGEGFGARRASSTTS